MNSLKGGLWEADKSGEKCTRSCRAALHAERYRSIYRAENEADYPVGTATRLAGRVQRRGVRGMRTVVCSTACLGIIVITHRNADKIFDALGDGEESASMGVRGSSKTLGRLTLARPNEL